MMESSMRTRETALEECDSQECKLPKKHEGLCDICLPVTITYINWKGRTAKRKVAPTGQVSFQSTEFHKLPQWLFECIDCEDGKQKLFAFAGVTTGLHLLEDAIQLRWHRVS